MRGSRGAIVLLWCAVGCASEERLLTRGDSIVGGVAESGYPAAGWVGAATSTTPFCGATLIAPDAALTAAHCVNGARSDLPLVFSHGVVGAEPRYAVTAVHIHPSYDPTRPGFTVVHHDLAVLSLERAVDGIEPATIAPGIWVPDEPELTAILVGYGRTTAGGPGETSGYTWERKSAHYRVNGMTRYRIDGSSIDGGGCYGDSGSPLLWPDTDQVIGTLSVGGSTCDVYNWHMFVNLMEERGFLCAAAPGATTTVGSCAELCAAGLDCVLSCTADAMCVDWCEPDPDCCIDDGMCHPACMTEPDCCGSDDSCNEQCDPDDPDCPCDFDGACTVACHDDPDCTCVDDGACDYPCPLDPDCPECAEDGICTAGCNADPDCPVCAEDGACEPACQADPDCETCIPDGNCQASCTADPDCIQCGSDGACVAECLDDPDCVDPTPDPPPGPTVDAGVPVPDAGPATPDDDGGDGDGDRDEGDDGGCLAVTPRPASPLLILAAIVLVFQRRAYRSRRSLASSSAS